MGELRAVVLAAGEGTRMRSAVPKVLHPLCGRPMLRYILDSAAAVAADPIIVVNPRASSIRESIGPHWSYAVQEEQLGTGHALMQALPQLPGDGSVLVLCGDTPLLEKGHLEQLVREHGCNAATVMTAEPEDPAGYGRVIRDVDGSVLGIVEERDATAAERKVREINSGTYCFDLKLLREFLPLLSPENAQGEYYLPEILSLMRRKGHRIGAYRVDRWPVALGINDRRQLAAATAIMRERINRSLMDQGVTMIDPSTTYIDHDVHIGMDTEILPQTSIEGSTVIGCGCRIGPAVQIINTRIHDGVVVRHSVVEGSVLGDGSTIGPFANIRPGCRIGSKVKIGDFVEVKNSAIGAGSKLSHLSYAGDVDIAEGVNLGAGVIIVNFDGRRKYRSSIGAGSFVGCNSNLISPLDIGPGSFVAAGTTVTRDVPADALAINRIDQQNYPGLGKRLLSGGERQEKKDPGEKE